MMRILVVNPMLYTAPPKGGAVPRRDSINDCMIIALCHGFTKTGHSVTLIASEEYRPLKEHKFDFEIKYFKNAAKRYVPRFPNGMPILSGFRKWLKANESEYDIVICSELLSFATMTAASICPHKVKVWQEFGAHHPLCFRIPSIIWHNTIVKRIISRQDIPVIPRSSIAADFASRYCSNVSPNIVNNCVDGDIFSEAADKSDRLICIAQLIRRKNVAYVIDMYMKYVRKYNDCCTELFIVGDGEMKSELMRIAASEPRVIFKGMVPHSELSHLLSSSKGFLFASIADLNCVSITESIVSGVPVLTNDIPYQAQFIAENKLGIVKSRWNEDDIHDLLASEKEFSQNCVRIRKAFTNDNVAKMLLQG